MTVNAEMKHFLRPFRAEANPTMFLVGLAMFDPEFNVHNSEFITIDIERIAEKIAIAQPDVSGGYRDVTSDFFTNKQFKPPVIAEGHRLNNFELTRRQFGQSPFDDVNIRRNAMTQSARNIRIIRDRVMRALELQMAQLMQTGTITCINEAGTTVYTISFGAKATHFPTVSTSWSNGASTPLEDIRALATVIRNNGKAQVDNLLFGEAAWDNFYKHADVQSALDNRRIDLGFIRPQTRSEGATYMGPIWIGDKQYNMWTYGGQYDHPQTGAATKYVGTDNVVMWAGTGSGMVETRIDLTYGRYLPLRPPLPEARQFMPPSMNVNRISMDLNAWFNDSGTSLSVGAGTRPLCVPVGIDTFGCLDTSA